MGFYYQFFKQAFRITKQYKFLWIFGLFLIAGNLLFAWYNQTNILLKFQNYWVLALLVGSVLVFVLYFRAKAGLIVSIKAINDKQEASFGQAFKVSRFFYPRILGIFFMLELGVLLLGYVIGFPIEYLFSHGYLYRGIGLLVLGLLIFIPVAVLVLFINVLAPMFVVIYDLTIREAIDRSFALVTKYWVRLILLALMLFLIEVPALFLGVIVIGLQGGLVIIISSAVVFLIVESIVAVFQQTAWVLIFLDLIQPQKLEEAEPEVVVPEILS